MRSSVAYAISAIAHWDWPEAWPDLFGLLMMMITKGDSNEVHGAMRVLTGMPCYFQEVVFKFKFNLLQQFELKHKTIEQGYDYKLGNR